VSTTSAAKHIMREYGLEDLSDLTTVQFLSLIGMDAFITEGFPISKFYVLELKKNFLGRYQEYISMYIKYSQVSPILLRQPLKLRRHSSPGRVSVRRH